jgi:ATP-dependent Clp protease adaptor protein ClpS
MFVASTTMPDIKEKLNEKLKQPSQYVVILHNDPVTLREFVVLSLKKFFSKGEPEATRIMMQAHQNGVGAVGSYSYEIAETRVARANEYAASEGYPLFYSIENNT